MGKYYSPCIDVCKYRDDGHCRGCSMTKPKKMTGIGQKTSNWPLNGWSDATRCAWRCEAWAKHMEKYGERIETAPEIGNRRVTELYETPATKQIFHAHALAQRTNPLLICHRFWRRYHSLNSVATTVSRLPPDWRSFLNQFWLRHFISSSFEILIMLYNL